MFLAFIAPLSSTGATLKWVGTAGALITASTSWVVVDPVSYQPTGAGNQAPTAADALVFDGAQTPTVSVQTTAADFNISQLFLINNVSASFIAPSNGNGDGTIILTNNISGDDLIVSAGSSLTLSSTASTTNRYTTLKLNTGATAAIAGTVTLTGNGNGSPLPQRLIAASSSAIQVQNGGSIVASNIIGYPFGTTGTIPTGNNNTNSDVASTAGSVVFNSGATFRQVTGGEPFGNGSTGIAVFNSGSTYIYSGGTFSSVGQQYGNLQLLATATVAGTANLTILNDLTVTGATVNLNVVGTGTMAGTSIGGNVFINSNATPTAGTLNFAPASASNVIFNGTAAQSVGGIGTGSGSGTLTFGGNARLVINNTSGTTTGVTLLKPLTVAAGLTLTNGVLTTLPVGGVSNALSVPYNVASSTDALVTGGSSSSFVSGPLTRSTSAAATGRPNIVYPVGSIRAGALVYRPVTFSPNQPSANTYTIQQIEGAPTNRTFPADNSIRRVSRIRYYTLTTGSGATFNNATITLTFGPDDQVDNGNFLRIAQGVGTSWVNLSGNTSFTSTTPPYFSGSIQSSQPFSTGGDFVLASTQLSQAAGNNPLPVTLISFSAERRGQAVLVNWATAIEKNNASFEVLRSNDGKSFQVISRVKGQGTTNSSSTYTFIDNAALNGLTYYQLRQVDLDGTATLSSVVVVAAELQATFYPNPSNTSITLPAIDGGVEYQIYSVTGKAVASGKSAGNATVDVQSIPAGVYILELTSAGKRTVQRFVRQ
ncbi:beta strand repeat-containing protein [Hymenobacter pini]|uniref:beta strand repeat-containing protein n=1 Tax=Hymenobacter pini TaxID=2880879 RepID=UPI001CF0F953|nr:T9SS type A sorting domain-containing protein [Hymenobacter pini]MCA8831426.1 T9SS type A sorting domain-containing protein [Hymenobacter pini]